MKLKHYTDLFILSKDKRPVNSKGQYSTIDNAVNVPYQQFKAAREHGYTISLKLGPIGDTGYSIYCIDCDHCDFSHPVYKWMKSIIDTPQLVELSQSKQGAHIFIIKRTDEEFETRFMDFTGQQLEVWTRVRHIVSPNLETIVDVELCEHNVALFDKLIELSDEQERLKAEQYERDRQKYEKRKQKKNYTFVAPETDISEEFIVHSLRHSFATRLVEEGIPLVQVKELLGHSCIRSTMTYVHVANNMQKVDSPLDKFMRKGEEK